jgi:hypothetical protein
LLEPFGRHSYFFLPDSPVRNGTARQRAVTRLSSAPVRAGDDLEQVAIGIFEIDAATTVVMDGDIKDVDRYLAAMHDAAARKQAVKVRDAMIAIRDLLRAAPKDDW